MGFEALVVMLLLLGLIAFVVILVMAVFVNTTRRRGTELSALPSQHPLSIDAVEHISALVERERHIEAIKVLREVTSLDLATARRRILSWSPVMELEAARGATTQVPPAPALPGNETRGTDRDLRIEASAIMTTSGWHTAEQFLREQRGLSPEAAKSLLDSLS